jgi:hypothetical protein
MSSETLFLSFMRTVFVENIWPGLNRYIAFDRFGHVSSGPCGGPLVAYCPVAQSAPPSPIASIAGPEGRYIEHQVHHRGQVHAMLAGTSVAPPQLDEFVMDGDADVEARRPEVTALGWTEDELMR